MGRPVTLTTTDASGGATTSAVWQPDTFITPFEIGVAMDITGTVNMDLEFTLDDPTSASALWWDDATIVGDTADIAIKFTTPCRGIRMKQNSGNGSSRTVLIQAG